MATSLRRGLTPVSVCVFGLLLCAPLTARAVDHVSEEKPDEIEHPPETSTDTASSMESGPAGTSPIAAPASKSGAQGLAPGATKKPLQVQIPAGRRGSGGLTIPVEMFNCTMPNRKATVEAVLKRPGMAAALTRLCRNKTDWTFLDAVVDELRKRDRRWGYFCRRGNCGDPSHDVLSYYCGPGSAVNGSDNAVGVDFIVASCYDPGDGATPSIGWGVFEGGNPVGTRAWTSRGRFKP